MRRHRSKPSKRAIWAIIAAAIVLGSVLYSYNIFNLRDSLVPKASVFDPAVAATKCNLGIDTVFLFDNSRSMFWEGSDNSTTARVQVKSMMNYVRNSRQAYSDRFATIPVYNGSPTGFTDVNGSGATAIDSIGQSQQLTYFTNFSQPIIDASNYVRRDKTANPQFAARKKIIYIVTTQSSLGFDQSQVMSRVRDDAAQGIYYFALVVVPNTPNDNPHPTLKTLVTTSGGNFRPLPVGPATDPAHADLVTRDDLYLYIEAKLNPCRYLDVKVDVPTMWKGDQNTITFTYANVVGNRPQYSITDVTISQPLPAGLVTLDGQRTVSFTLPNLVGGQTETRKVTVKAEE